MHTRIRRKQFSSCDACRRSRVACDAVRGQSGSCSRCEKRSRQCSFEWMAAASQPISRARTRNRSPSVIPSDTAHWLQTIYENVFEAVFGSWLGNYSCPFAWVCLPAQQDSTHSSSGFRTHGSPAPAPAPAPARAPGHEPAPFLSISIASLCRQFDRLMRTLEAKETPATLAEATREAQIDAALTQAIHAFSARWLPLTAAPSTTPTPLITHLWRTLRQNLPQTMNRPCYRSMLTLYLFSMVPVPTDIPDAEEETGIPAQVCVQAALQQVQYLRARQRSLEFNGSKVHVARNNAAMVAAAEPARAHFLRLEAMIYWAALTFDTSAALTFNTNAMLSAGLLGWGREAAWRMVQACAELFHEETEGWRRAGGGVVVGEQTAERIIAAAQAWKLRVWKAGTVLKEALREGHGEQAVQGAFGSVREAVETFNGTYRPLLTACERRLPFLGEVTRLRWYELMLHYHLCILIIVDAIETASREDLLDRMHVAQSEAEGGFMTCLRFGLDNHFTLPNQEGVQSESESGPDPITVPLVAIDPYPHHVVAGVQLLWKGIGRDGAAGELRPTTCQNLQSVLLQTLELLPQTSKSVRKATEEARDSLLSQSR